MLNSRKTREAKMEPTLVGQVLATTRNSSPDHGMHRGRHEAYISFHGFIVLLSLLLLLAEPFHDLTIRRSRPQDDCLPFRKITEGRTCERSPRKKRKLPFFRVCLFQARPELNVPATLFDATLKRDVPSLSLFVQKEPPAP